MSDLVVVRLDPVQEIAAEPATLDLLRDILRPKAVEPRATPELLYAARLTGWPLVYDEKIPPGYVHCRPTPGSPPPLAAEQIADCLGAFMPKEQRMEREIDGRTAITDAACDALDGKDQS